MLAQGNIDWEPAHYSWMPRTVVIKGKYHLHLHLASHTQNQDDYYFRFLLWSLLLLVTAIGLHEISM